MTNRFTQHKKDFQFLKCAFVCLLAALIRLNGQPHAELYSNVNTTSGLSNNRITAIVQDSWGLIWIGTKDGLNVYDGSRFVTYSTSNSNLKSNDISKLYVDQQKRLWVGTVEGGAYLYNEKKTIFEQVYQTQNNEKLSQTIYGFFESYRGNLWCATQNGLYNISLDASNTPFTSIAIDSKLSKDEKFTVTAFFQRDSNNLWLGTKEKGIINLNTLTNEFSKVAFKSSAKVNIDFINTFRSIAGNDLLIGTNGFGVYLVNTENAEISAVPLQKSNGAESSIIREIFVSQTNMIWIATDGNGLFYKDAESQKQGKQSRFKPLNVSTQQEVGKSVTVIFEDNQSNLWFGSARNGIKIKHPLPSYLRFITLEEKKRSILSIYKRASRFYLGTDGYGLLEKEKEWRNYVTNKTLESNFIQCVVPDNKSSLWLGTFNSGVFEYNLATRKSKRYNHSPNSINTLSFNDVRDILIHPNGDKWVATWGGGLNRINSESRVTQVIDTGATHAKNILDLESGLEEELWLATYDEGFIKFSIQDNNFTFFDAIYKANGILNKQSYTLLFDKNKNVLWIGSKDGLLLFKPNDNKLKQFKIGEDSNANEVVSLLQDAIGHLWMGTKEGLYHFDPETYEVDKIPFTDFEFHINSKYQDAEGKMYFGGVNGVVEVNPFLYFQNEKTRNKPTKTIVSGIQVLDYSEKPKNESIPFSTLDTTQIELPYTSNAITFYFSTLNFSAFDKVSHEIKLEGFDKQWRNVGRLNHTTYTNLNPGTYTFKARRENTAPRPVFENAGAQVVLEITPPFWKTPWAYFIEIILAGALFVFIRRYTIRWFEVNNQLKNEAVLREKEVQLHHQKERFFANISHEMRTPLTLISGAIHALLRSRLKPENQRKINDLQVCLERLLRLSNEILTFGKLPDKKTLSVSKNNLTDFIKEIFLTFSQQAIIKEISYHFHNETDSPLFAYFDKIEFEKVIYNLLSNAFKFTENGGEITVRLNEKKKCFQMEVSDSGRGIVSEELPYIFDRFYQGNGSEEKHVKGFGIGLAIVKEVISLHGGTIDVESEQNKGTCFLITIPKGREHFDDFAIRNSSDHQELSLNKSAHLNSIIVEDEIKGSSILLIEDDYHIRMYIKEILMNQFSVIEAVNGKEGYSMAQDEIPDLIITDVMMPEMDGVTMCYKLKKNLTTSHIPVIMLSAKTMTKNILEGYQGGADDYITKPFSEDILQIRIRNLLMLRLKLRKNFALKDYLDAKHVHVTSNDEIFFAKLFSILQENLSDFDYNATQLAKDMCMSHSALYKKIKVLTNMTLIGLIKKFKMNYAHKLISGGGITVSEASYRTGYGDVKYFRQEFKKTHGVLPSAVKKKCDRV